MRSSAGHIHNRLGRHSRRRRLMLVSYDAAACPSLDDEHIDEQILLAPEIVASVTEAAEAINLRNFGSTSLLDAASNLVSGSATGSAVLADFPDVECEISSDVEIEHAQRSGFDPDSVFDEVETGVSDPPRSGKIILRAKDVNPANTTTDKKQPSLRLKPDQTVADVIGDGSQGLQQIRGWLHEQQPRVWMFLGDETTAWLRHNGKPGFAEMFRHRLRWELRRFPDLIVNAGVANASIDELVKIAKQGLAQCHPDVAFVLPGKADGQLAASQPQQYFEKLTNLASLLRSNGTEPVLQTPPLPEFLSEEKDNDKMRLLSDLIREVAVVNNTALIDHAEFWQEQTIEQNWVDLFNNKLTSAGQSVLAMLFFTELDIFDQSSELCGKLQDAWGNQSIASLARPVIEQSVKN